MSRPIQATLVALPGIPLVAPGDDLARFLLDAVAGAGLTLADGDILVLAQKIVSKAENRFVDLKTVTPSAAALDLARATGKDARLVELILAQSRRVVRSAPNLLIVEHRLGFVMANAGIDQSNVAPAGEAELVLLLPEWPDESAERLRQALAGRTGAKIAVVINDSFGRAWRQGTSGVAIGAAGLPALVDRRGDPDLFGRALRATTIGFADEIAAAASLLMGQADEGRPAVLVRGLAWSAPASNAAALIRPAAEDLFR